MCLCWLACLLGCQQSPPESQEKKDQYKVIAIKDGDTIELLKDGKPLRVRLQGVDTPEKRQDFGTKAQQFTSDMVFGQLVSLVVHDIDRYGRTVGEIILPDGRNLGYELVKAGFAWHYTAYSKDPELARLEAEARLEKRGLWADPAPVAPWEFRRPAAKKADGSKAKTPAAAAKTASTASVSTSSRTGKAYICESPSAKTYHADKNCHLLKRCKSSIGTVTLAQAKIQNRTGCKVCTQ